MENKTPVTTPAVQVATPYSTGTGFYWKEADLYVTCEHIVRDNREVIVQHLDTERETATVVFTDPVYDVAFLQTEYKAVKEGRSFAAEKTAVAAELTAWGFTPNARLKKENLRLVSANFRYEGKDYFLLDEEIESDFAGSPLLDADDNIAGMNLGFFADEDYQLALPAAQIKSVYADYQCGNGKVGTRCHNCEYVFFSGEVKKQKCPKCGDYLLLPDQAKEYRPSGVSYTIERIIEKTGYSARTTRRGPNNWQVQQGSARINISYYEKNGLISGDAHLCLLPEDEAAVLPYLLEQNHRLEGLTFSIDRRDIILSLLIHDRYLNVETGVKLLRHLFRQADYYDNVLVEEFGAGWYF